MNRSKDCITNENLLIAKAVITGVDCSAKSMALFNSIYIELCIYLNKRYKLPLGVSIPDYKEKAAEYQIIVPVRDELSESADHKSTFASISSGEFIYNSLKSWNVEESKYLTYIDRLLKDFGQRVPIDVTVEQYEAEKWIKRSIPNLGNNSGKDVTAIPATQISELSYEKKIALVNFRKSFIELDAPIGKDDDEDSTSQDIITTDYIDPTVSQREEINSILSDYYQLFLSLQERSRKDVALYLTNEFLKVFLYCGGFSELKDRTLVYPDMIKPDDINWIEAFYLQKRAEYDSQLSEDFNEKKLFPSMADLAEYLGYENRATYDMRISRFRKIAEKYKNIIKQKYRIH